MEEVKKDTVQVEENKKKEPVPVYAYTVTRYSDNSYNVSGISLDPEHPENVTIDDYHAKLDAIKLGEELHDKRLIDIASQVAVNYVFNEMNKLAAESKEEKIDDDPTRA